MSERERAIEEQVAALLRQAGWAREQHRCAAPPLGCGRSIPSLATQFRDQPSRDEYEITSRCQSCQDLDEPAPIPGQLTAMATDPHYGRCNICGEYRALEFVDVGVGVISGFDCCPVELANTLPRCSERESTHSMQCRLTQDHRYGHDFPPPPITLTREQMDIFSDAVILDPDPPWREKVNRIPGRHIVLCETVDESTPHIEGWL